jgi:hypothetical protein
MDLPAVFIEMVQLLTWALVMEPRAIIKAQLHALFQLAQAHWVATYLAALTKLTI